MRILPWHPACRPDCGPMGLVAIDLALHGDVRPSLLVVTDLDQERLDWAKKTVGSRSWTA